MSDLKGLSTINKIDYLMHRDSLFIDSELVFSPAYGMCARQRVRDASGYIAQNLRF